MSVCLYTYIFTCKYAFIHFCVSATYIHTYSHACMHTYIWIYTYTFMHFCIYRNIFTCIQPICMHPYRNAYIHMYVCTYVHSHSCQKTHTDSHVCLQTCVLAYIHFSLEALISLELSISTIFRFVYFKNMHTFGNMEIWEIWKYVRSTNMVISTSHIDNLLLSPMQFKFFFFIFVQ